MRSRIANRTAKRRDRSPDGLRLGARSRQGIAVVRARQLSVTPHALAVIDRGTATRTGGTGDFLNQWTSTGFQASEIDLASLRDFELPVAARTSQPPEAVSTLPRPVQAMLFADVAGFSRMVEEYAPKFFRLFPHILAATLQEAADSVRLKNTWGDGVFVVIGRAKSETPAKSEAESGGVAVAAEFALRLIEAFDRAEANWQEMGFAAPNPLRVALHVGPVFELDLDPVLGRTNYFGQHVTRTARIEPITLPGSVYASEQFAALLTVTAPRAYECEYVGVELLAKGYASAPIYRVQRSPEHS